MTLIKTPLLIAHRGERVLSPENTIKACQLALEQGATGLEVDIRLCRAGEIILMHDPFLRQHFGKRKPVIFSSLAEIKSLSFSQREYQFPDSVCTLEEFLEEFKGRVPINLDAKSLTLKTAKFAKKLAKLFERMEIRDQVWVSSFNPLLIKNIKAIKSTIRTGYLFQNPAGVHKFIDTFLSTDAWHPHFKNVTQKFMKRAKQLGKEVYIWTVNDEAVLSHIQQFDFHGIITDRFFRTSDLKKVKEKGSSVF